MTVFTQLYFYSLQLVECNIYVFVQTSFVSFKMFLLHYLAVLVGDTYDRLNF